MLKYAFMFGIAAQWLIGPAVHTLPDLAYAMVHALMYMLLAWMGLEAIRAVGKFIGTFDDRVSKR